MLGKVNEYKVEVKEQEEDGKGEGGEDYDDVGENMKQEQHNTHIIKTILKVCFTLKTHNQSGSMLLHKLFLLHIGLWHYAAVAVIVVVFKHEATLLAKKCNGFAKSIY